jgi:hypothetical protein
VFICDLTTGSTDRNYQTKNHFPPLGGRRRVCTAAVRPLAAQLAQHSWLCSMPALRRLASVHAAMCPQTSSADSATVPDQPVWQHVEFEATEAAAVGDQLLRMGRGEVPAIVLRNAYSAAECQEVLSRLEAADQFPDTFASRLTSLDGDRQPVDVPASGPLVEAPIVRGTMQGAHRNPNAVRWDIGTSLGNLGADPEAFFADADRTHGLFSDVFGPMGDRGPLKLMHDGLTALSGGTKRAMCAESVEGRRYGPGIFRSYRPGGAHGAHFDSVRYREQRTNYSVYDFEVQFAGILLLQSPDRLVDTNAGVTEHFENVGGLAAEVARRGEAGLQDSFIYDIEGKDATVQLERQAKAGEAAVTLGDGFRDLAQREGIACAPVRLQTGDMYFFKCDQVHEVPAFGGDASRVVLATFIGWSEDNPRIFVWS